MEYQGYLAAIERHFQKSEYISIAKTGAKMLWEPMRFKGKKLFCFVLNGAMPSGDLVKKLAKYAESITFYESKKANEKINVITLFVYKDMQNSSRKAIFEKAIKSGCAFVLPAAFDISEQKLYLPSKCPIFTSGEFNEISAFCKKVLTQKNTED